MSLLNGLVVCGGMSSRMGVDKSMLEYHGLPHRHYLFNILKNHCESVYLSLNEFQEKDNNESYPCIVDEPEFSGIGPMSALLSAWKKFPGTSWLVAGCDYPYINEKIIQTLLSSRGNDATCFVFQNNIHEPLITIYETAFHRAAVESFNRQNYSLSKLLAKENVNIIRHSDETVLKNVNTIDEYNAVKQILNNKAY